MPALHPLARGSTRAIEYLTIREGAEEKSREGGGGRRGGRRAEGGIRGRAEEERTEGWGRRRGRKKGRRAGAMAAPSTSNRPRGAALCPCPWCP